MIIAMTFGSILIVFFLGVVELHSPDLILKLGGAM